MQKKLIIVGTGLFAEVACEYFTHLSEFEVVSFACHEKYKEGDSIYGRPLIAIEQMQQKYIWSSLIIFYLVKPSEIALNVLGHLECQYQWS